MGVTTILREKMEKYCLKWSEFEGNIRQSFEELRNENKLYDVTLTTDDGDQIQAHRVILSAGSTFFQSVAIRVYACI